MAAGKGIKVVISTDSHSLEQVRFQIWGVAVARRGWYRKEEVVNARTWEEIEKFKDLRQKRIEKSLQELQILSKSDLLQPVFAGSI